MTDFLDRISKLSPKRLALLALEQHEQIEATSRRERGPIAVIGMACRLPGGADTPAAFWDLLREGRDAIGEVPRDRWDIDAFFDPDPDVPGRMAARSGGFLADVSQFDPAFFGISPREALTMDPQQRLLLEVSWEALEHAGLAADRLVGSATGVFVGICNSDHFNRVLSRGADSIDAYLASGSAHSVAAGRISYYLGLQGPALSIDTACSSSLVALHVACRSLRTGESRVALAAGVNVMCSPETTIALSKAHMLAPDGRCKTFDASADGFSRGEGCGVLVLKRLEDAVADGDRVLALIRGTAANQDGRSGGLTVPNGPAQESVIRAALADAGVESRDIDYVEAHGTGTSLGDPIEVRALAGALGEGRSHADPLVIGSVKTNIGHLESAAGIAGVMKVVLSLQNERIPPHLHFKQPSPHISWGEYPVRVEPQGKAWLRGTRRRLAGVSSFGFSGTNAHVILEEAPPASSLEAVEPRLLHTLPLSARSGEALSNLAASYADALTTVSLADAVRTAGSGRSHFVERAAVTAATVPEAQAALRALAGNITHPMLKRGTAVSGQAPEVVFLFTGQGSQYPGMSHALYEGSAVFREVIDQCDSLLGADSLGRTLKSVLFGQGGDDAPIHETRWTQPALFAVEYGLAQVWRSWGVEPAAVIGHSVGEYVAACVGGVFSLEDGLRLIAERGRLMHALPANGTMAALFAPVEEVAAAVAPLSGRVAIAAINAADSVVISGEVAAIESVLEGFAKRNIRGHRLFISLAAHSPLVEPALDAMQACAASVAMQAPRIPVAWNLTGGRALPGGAPDATYWRRHLREPVRFADGITGLFEQGFRTFLEVGPHPTLIALAQRSLPEDGTLLVSSLRRGKEDWSEMVASLADLYVHGASVDWNGVNGSSGGRPCTLPTYPFERRKFWIPAAAPTAFRGVSVVSGNTLRAVRLPTAAPLFQTVLAPTAPSYLQQHLVRGSVLVAGPVFLELAQACANEALGGAMRAVEEFVIREPLVLPAAGRTVEVALAGTSFSVSSRDVEGKGEWTLHAMGRLVTVKQFDSAGPAHPAALGASLGPVTDSLAFYAKLHDLGIDLGGAFRSVREVHRRDGEVLARVELAEDRVDDAVIWAHPGALDGALQAVGIAVPEAADASDVYLLTGVQRLALRQKLPREFWCHAVLRSSDSPRPAEWLADVRLLDSSGADLGAISGVRLQRAARETVQQPFYQVRWEESPPPIRAAALLASPQSFEADVRGNFARLAVEYGMAVYDDLLPELDRLSRDHVIVALQRLGFDTQVGRVFDVAVETARLGIVARHARLFARMLDILVEDRLLARRGNGAGVTLEVIGALECSDPPERYDALLKRFGAVNGELLTLRRCAGELAGVLAGTQDPLHLLFPGGSLTEARQLYVESPYARTYNTALAQALRSAIAGLPSGARLRVLEIGAGTGGTTTYVLPSLPADRVEYTYTDLSPLFLERAAEQFEPYTFIKYELLDIEKDPVPQGFERGRYDIVIAANVLHATADLGKAVSNARDLLAPGGQLFLLEGVAPERWVDLTFGLTEGWWRFTDSRLRPAYPLISRDAWRDLLAGLGLHDAVAVPTIPTGGTLGRGAAQQALIVARVPTQRREWVLIGDQQGLGAALSGQLRARGDKVVQLAADASIERLPHDSELVYLGALELGGSDETADDAQKCEALACELPLRWLGAVVGQGTAARVWFVTRGAQAVAARDQPMAMSEQAGSHLAVVPGTRWQAPLWGLGRVFALEQPSKWGGLVDLPADGDAAALSQMVIETIESDDLEDQVAWRGGKRHVARLLPVSAPADVAALQLRADATYLVTGGFGGLGLLVAKWMAQRGARHIALVGRNPDMSAPGVREVEALGTRVVAIAADVADEEAMRTHLTALAATAPPLRGIVHAAAALSTAPIGELDSGAVRSMLRPKITGTVVLERLTRDLELDFVVLFSSTTALLGVSGMAHYAAANAFLDATAVEQSAHGRRTLSVNWGTWEAMRLASAETQRTYRAAGLEPMPATDALSALERLLAGNEANVAVAHMNWSVLKALHESRRVRPLLSHLGNDGADLPARRGGAVGAGRGDGAALGVGTAGSSAPSLLERLARVAAPDREELLIEFVRGEAAAVLGVDSAEAVAPDVGLFEMGMDSLMSVELRRRLEKGAGRKLPSTLTFNYPNVAALAGYLQRELVVPDQVAPMAAIPRPAAPAEASAVSPQSAAPRDTDNLDDLSDEELEARLLARLSETR